ncbi:sensor histidine kinase [Sphaerimonospora sp. CA-214678]|uniref:sensor histidine kinase n=1 Tax=Sphaerimonospora sp. CA-214678 TaxID=3240029 RepID=UPI003D8FB532
MWGLRVSSCVRSLYAWFTLLCLFLAAPVLLPGGLLTAKITRDRDAASWWGSGREAIPAAARRVRTGRSDGTAAETGAVAARGPNVEPPQAAGPAGRLTGRSGDLWRTRSGGETTGTPSAAQSLAPLGVVGGQAGEEQLWLTRACPDPDEGCLLPAMARVWPEPVPPVGNLVRRVAGAAVGMLDILLVLQAVVLVTLSIWAVRTMVGRTLRPIREICAALERINHCGEGRIEEPRGRDDIARLAGCINATLDQIRQMRKFTSDVSHELRTPLTALRLQVEELQLSRERVDLDELLRQELRDIERLEGIISDLLLLARLKEGPGAVRHAPVDLGELTREEVGLRAGRIPVQLDVQSDVWVLGVRTQLQRVLRNLLDNAQRHAISTIRVVVGSNGWSAELAVADDGHGVSVEDRERIFERFTRLEESRRLDPGGTGLGLAISREIVKAHEGTLHVEDSWNGGACFLLGLPLLSVRRRELHPTAPVERVVHGAPGEPEAPVHIRWIDLTDGRRE